MNTLHTIVVLGFFLGMRHATDPDHVVAVSTIVSRHYNARKAVLIGALWGMGHTATILTVGMAIILFHVVIPVRLGLGFELAVAAMLIILGYINLGRQLGQHSHDGEEEHEHDFNFDSSVHIRSLAIGVVHGLAGSAAIALFILSTISNPYWAVAYLAVFGIGTVAGMIVITTCIATSFSVIKQRFATTAIFLSGLGSLGFGLYLAYEICVVQGLFGVHPTWIPQ